MIYHHLPDPVSIKFVFYVCLQSCFDIAKSRGGNVSNFLRQNQHIMSDISAFSALLICESFTKGIFTQITLVIVISFDLN